GIAVLRHRSIMLCGTGDTAFFDCRRADGASFQSTPSGHRAYGGIGVGYDGHLRRCLSTPAGGLCTRPLQCAIGRGVIPHAFARYLAVGMVVLDIRGGNRDDYWRRFRGDRCPVLYYKYLRYGRPEPTDHASTGIYCQLGNMATYYRYHWTVAGYQPTLYVHTTQPPRPVETPRPCRTRRLVPATDHRGKYQAGADVSARQIKARMVALHGFSAAKRRTGTVSRRRVFQSHYGKDADLWRHRRAGYLLMAGLPRGCLSQPLAPESRIAHEACSYFVRLLDSWFCL